MKKHFFRIIAAALILCMLIPGCSGSGEGNGKEVVVYNWEDYIDESVNDQFYEETGIKVKYVKFTTNEDMYAMLSRGSGSYDVIIPSEYMIERLIKEDMLLPIDFKNVPNFSNIDPALLNAAYDPENKYSVPYMWGTLGILYDTTKVSEPITSWDAIWDEQYKGQILMIDSIRDAMGIALIRLGYSANSRNDAELEAAKESLFEQKPLVQAYVLDEAKDKMKRGVATMAVVYSGDAITAMDENENLAYVVPSEGSNIWYDSLVIPKTSKNKEAAEKYIDFLCRPDIALKNAEAIGYSSPNNGAKELMDEETLANESIYPSEETIARCEMFVDLGDALEKYDEIWTQLKMLN